MFRDRGSFILRKIKTWLKKKLCTHEFKEAKVLGISEESSSGFKLYHEVYTLECIRCTHTLMLRNKEDADYVLKESDTFHSIN